MTALYREQRNQQIFDIALTGVSYYQLGDRFGLTNVAVWKIVRTEAKRRWGKGHKNKLRRLRRQTTKAKMPQKIRCTKCKDTYRNLIDKKFILKYGHCIHCQEERYSELLDNKVADIS